jgi:hypothetical protein
VAPLTAVAACNAAPTSLIAISECVPADGLTLPSDKDFGTSYGQLSGDAT